MLCKYVLSEDSMHNLVSGLFFFSNVDLCITRHLVEKAKMSV